MSTDTHYTHWTKVIEWSDEDNCFLGSLPGRTFGHCCHGTTEEEVLHELQDIAKEISDSEAPAYDPRSEKYRYEVSATLPAGSYYLGDPCYCVRDALWVKFAEVTIDYEKEHSKENPLGLHAFEFEGVQCLSFATGVGDGSWYDEDGNRYGVDSGGLGLTPGELCDRDEDPTEACAVTCLRYGGRLVRSSSPVSVSFSFGWITVKYTDEVTGKPARVDINLYDLGLDPEE